MVDKNKNKREVKKLKRKLSPKPTVFYTEGGELFSKEGKSYRGFYRVEGQKIFSGKLKYKNSIELYEVQDEDSISNDYRDEENNTIEENNTVTLDPKIIREFQGGEDAYSIDINKKTYNKEQLTQIINTEFEEFFSINTFTIDQFFNIYDELYYTIPIEGSNSHTTLIERSNDMLENDIFENERNSLLSKIEDLEDRINILENEVPEHPVFLNGTFIAVTGEATIFYMDGGVARPIREFGIYVILLKAKDPTQRGLSDDEIDGSNHIIRMSPDALSQVPKGPPYTYNDLTGKNTTSPSTKPGFVVSKNIN